MAFAFNRRGIGTGGSGASGGVAISVSATTLLFTAQETGASPPVQFVFVSNRATDAPMPLTDPVISYGSGVQDWLSASAVTDGLLQVSASVAGLPDGTYAGAVDYTVPGAVTPARRVNVTLVVTPIVVPPVMSFDPSATVPPFGTSEGGAAPSDQVVTVRDQFGAPLADATVGTITGAWCTAVFNTPGVLTIHANPTSLTTGTYPATIEITSATAGNSPQTITASLVISVALAPTIGISDTTLDYTTVNGSGDVLPQTVTLSNSGSGGTLALTATVVYAVTPTWDWLVLSSATPSLGAFIITALSTRPGSSDEALAVGTHTAKVRLNSAGATNSPADVDVSFVVTARPIISLVPPGVAFTMDDGDADPANIVVDITNTGGGTLTPTVGAVVYELGGATGWATAVWNSAVPGTITFSAAQGVLPPGIYIASVAVTDALATDRSIPIYFTIADLAPPGTPSPLNAPSTTYPYIPRPTEGVSILPRTYIDSRYDRGGTPLTFASDVLLTDAGDLPANLTTNATNVQNAIDASLAVVGHSRIRAPSGFRHDNRVLFKKHTAGDYYTYLEWDDVNVTLAEGVRVTPAQMANAPSAVTSGGNVFWSTREGADNYRMSGWAWRLETDVTTTYLVYINAIKPDPASFNTLFPGANAQFTTADIPRNIGFDRCLFRGNPAATSGRGARHALGMNGIGDFMVDCWCEEIMQTGNESKCIGGGNGPGPYKIVNNFLGGGAIGIIFGGLTSSLPGLITRDLEIRRNHLFKPDRWNKNDAINWDGVTLRNIKNGFELKEGEFVLFEGNVIEGAWSDGQIGNSILLKAESQNGNSPHTVTRWGTMRYNWCLKTKHGPSIASGIPAGAVFNESIPLRYFEITHNLFEQTGASNQGAGSGKPFVIANRGTGDFLLRHNTIVTSYSNNAGLHLDISGIGAAVAPMGALTVKDNVVHRGSFGFPWGSGGVPVPVPVEGRNAFITLQSNPSTSHSHNLVIGGQTPANYPTGNIHATTNTAALFVDYAGGDYRLQATSPGHNAASDGTDCGVNFTDWAVAISGVRSLVGF